MEARHRSHYTMFSGFLRNLESHACYEDFVMVSFTFLINYLTALLFIAF